MTLIEKLLPKMYCYFGSGMLTNAYDENVALQNAKECEQIADEYAIEFALFLSLNCEINGDKDGWWFYNNQWKTTKELSEIFKKEKGL